jgi:hypothetical protein
LRRPFLSANDRSRWCTIRALVEPELRVEGRPYSIDKVIQEPNWDTIDMVKHDGHLYSSKPPLLPTILAGEYWLICRVTELTSGVEGGMTLATNPYAVGRFMLITFNVIPMLIYFWLLSRLVERLGTTDFGRLFVMGAATFGTFLTTFAMVLNNHLPAAVCAMAALYAAIRICVDGEHRWYYFVIAGFFAALAAANELPALALLGMLSLWLLWKAPVQTLLAFLPSALVVVAAFFATNYIAHEDLRPPYLHRSEGDNWYHFEYERQGEIKTSYWKLIDDAREEGKWINIDSGERNVAKYRFHVLVGRHGVFSLTPIWLLALAGAVTWIIRPRASEERQLAVLVLVVSLVCLAFYLKPPATQSNYGGVASGFRWMFWFAPLWLVVMIPAADGMGRWWWTRWIALLLLLVSVFSASYPTWNPWTMPWLWDYLECLQLPPWLVDLQRSLGLA